MKMNKSLLLATPLLIGGCAQSEQTKPNILWITIEDWSTDLSCYGTKGVYTPNIDKLASEGILYNNAYATAPVSSASRSAMMSGYYQNYVGGNQHRLSADLKQPLPHGIRPMPHLMRDAGYYTRLMSWKTDVNYLPYKGSDLFEDTRFWSERDKSAPFFNNPERGDKPFFARITLSGTHRSWDRDPQRPIDIKDVELPPYYADTDFVRRDWANGLEQVQLVDREVGELLEQIDREGLRDNTIIIFIADHGRCHIRGKQFLYEPGVKIPMVIRWPGMIEAGQIEDNMVSTLDICKTLIDVAEVTPITPYHGLNLVKDDLSKREYLFTSRDKMDDTHDAIRAVRSKDGFKLMHNLMPERAYLQYNPYKEVSYPVLSEMSYLYMNGELNEVQSRFFASTKPEYELYDLNNDPYEINNLAQDVRYRTKLKELQDALNKWREEVIFDKGVSEDFRAEGIYPETNPEMSSDLFMFKNKNKYDIKRYGLPSWYPTRSKEEWKKMRDIWKEWVFREPTSTMERPYVSPSQKRKKKK
ncbi:MAG: sulfatase [Rikenellaceae bacterium]